MGSAIYKTGVDGKDGEFARPRSSAGRLDGSSTQNGADGECARIRSSGGKVSSSNCSPAHASSTTSITLVDAKVLEVDDEVPSSGASIVISVALILLLPLSTSLQLSKLVSTSANPSNPTGHVG